MDSKTAETLRSAIDKIASGLTELQRYLNIQASPTSKKPHSSTENRSDKTKAGIAQSVTASELPPILDHEAEEWPLAVPSHLIVPSGDNTIKQFRAVQVVGLMNMQTQGMNVLDCGCGDGYVANELSNEAQAVVGYDIANSTTWAELATNNLTFTTSKKTVESKGPYDILLLYDVIDHLEGENSDSFVRWLSTIMKPNGRVYARCHPWSSRHGAHLYETKNKAYLHLAMTADELAIAGLKTGPNLKVVKPFVIYDSLFTKNGFNIETRKGQTEIPEPYFDDAVLDRIIKVTWKGAVDRETALRIMSIQFIDYHMTKSS